MTTIALTIKRFLAQVLLQPLTLYLIPFMLLLWFVSTFAVNVPYWDQWELTDLFEKVAAGKVSFQDFFAQHNEHRILFPKIILVGLAFTSQWNIGWELCLSILLAAIAFLSIYRIASLQSKARDFVFHTANLITCILVFSLVQWENWLWGFQVAWFLINACFVLTILVLSSSPPITWKSFSLAALLCGIASFSSAQGLLTWVVSIPLIFANRKNTRQFIQVGISWVALFFVCYRLYLLGYKKPSNHPPLASVFQQFSQIKDYIFRFLGTPLSNQSDLAMTIGFVLFINFIYFLILWLRRYKTGFFDQAAPWISLGLFPLLFGFVIAIARSEFGLQQASASRYTTISILLLVALVQLWRLELCSYILPKYGHKKLEPTTFNPLFLVYLVLGSLLALLSITSVAAIEEARSHRMNLQYGQRCLEITNYLPATQQDCLKTLYPIPELLLQKSKTLRQLGFMNPEKPLSIEVNPHQPHGYFDVPARLTSTAEMPGEPIWRISKNCDTCKSLAVKGWAINPAKKQAAQLVLLSYGDTISPPQSVIGTAVVGLPSADVAGALKSENYAHARWETTLSAKSIPAGTTIISAWMYDPVQHKLVKLNNTLKVEVEE